jgi:hypothetical protein
LPPGARSVQLPSNDHLRILAMTVARQPDRLLPAGALYAADLPEPAAPVLIPAADKR